MKRTAIYIRVSTLDQAENGYSLDMQEKTLRRWCDQNDAEVFKVYADRGISGKDMIHRPAMLELMDDAKDEKFDVVLFWALSRFTRSVGDLYNSLSVFQKHNISIFSYTESFDTSTPMGRAMVGIVGVFAQLERELTSERVAAAMKERAAQGKRTCHEVLGYDKVGSDTFMINESEAEYVKFCFTEYLEWKNLSIVAENARRRGFKGKRGREPSPWSVELILSRPVYCGYNLFNGELFKGMYESIIDVALFNQVQDILIERGKSVGRNRIEPINMIGESL